MAVVIGGGGGASAAAAGAACAKAGGGVPGVLASLLTIAIESGDCDMKRPVPLHAARPITRSLI